MTGDPGPGCTEPAALLGPAAHAARRTLRTQAPRPRPYPLPRHPEDATGDAVVLAATRALLQARGREEVAAVLHTAVNDLGGGLVPARLADAQEQALPPDVSLGVGEPRVVVVDPLSLAGMRLTHHLPGLIEDALTAAARCDAALRAEQRTPLDPRTGLPGRVVDPGPGVPRP